MAPARRSPAPSPAQTGSLQRAADERTPASGVPSIVREVLGSPGQPLDGATRAALEPRLGHDFGRVRVHTDARAAASAQAVNALAYTVGRDVVFGPGRYAPSTIAGRRLLAHELTHVVQQAGRTGAALAVTPPDSAHEREAERLAERLVPASGLAQRGPVAVSERSAPAIQRSFFGSLWRGIRAVGGAIISGVEWVGERIHDVANWAFNLIRDLPARLYRLGQTIVEGLAGVVMFIPRAIGALRSGGIKGFASWLWDQAKSAGSWVLTLVSRVLDVLGGPELAEFILHLLSRSRPLTAAERSAAQEVLGRGAIRWNEVRVDEGGILTIIFHFNKGRAFTTFHTINLPPGETIDTVVHELTHVYQYERAGSGYIGQAVHAQNTIGYGYGGAAGLRSAHAAGKHYREFNREQQAQIAQDYYKLLHSGGSSADLSAYAPYIAELRAGDL